MDRMVHLELVGLILLLSCSRSLSDYQDYHYPQQHHGGWRESGYRPSYGHNNYDGARTREIQIKYGRLRGKVVQPRGDNLPLVDVFLGIPYAEPPVGDHRFDPPKSQTPWQRVKDFVNFRPVCPQNLPNTGEEVDLTRHRHLRKLLPYLQNQSEDCLYLNIYAPHQEANLRNGGTSGIPKRHPVIMFIHGESYEWNSGNPYDGSVISAYGNVVFVTLNFRLGILGFLRPGVRDETASNFGLLDQAAALAWLQAHIGPFGGDPDNITLLGHGTGAVFANLLLLGNFRHLVNRAILMSGSALNPDAIGKAPMQITQQVAHALNCPQFNEEREFQSCLRNRSVQDLLSVKIDKPKYVPAFAPLVDTNLIPDSPHKIMEQHPDYLAKFDLMYGVTELEKFHVMPGVGLLHGLSNDDRDEFILDNVKASHELEPDLILDEVLQYYGDEEKKPRTGIKEKRNRDLALEVVSDSGVVAGLVNLANIHSQVNTKSWMYVFTHPRSTKDYNGRYFNQQQQIRQSVHGEDLPYVLGVPLDREGDGYYPSSPYDEDEVLLSKAMMDWWCNFAYSGNPNNMRPLDYSQSYRDGLLFEIDWPEYDQNNSAAYFNITTTPNVGTSYRSAEAEFWNDAIPNLLRRRPKGLLMLGSKTTSKPNSFQGALWNGAHGFNNTEAENIVDGNGGTELGSSNQGRDPKDDNAPDSPGRGIRNGDTSRQEGHQEDIHSGSSSFLALVIAFGLIFLVINVTALGYLYHKRQRMRSKATATGLLAHSLGRPNLGAGGFGNHLRVGHRGQDVAVTLPKTEPPPQPHLGYCSSASKPDIRELIKSDKAYDNNSNFGRNSTASTIDTKIKVREWIQQEIVHRCSPRFLRKTRETLQREHREKLMKQQRHPENDETAGAGLYSEECSIRVRPGNRRGNKVSVGVDATPATRTDSVLNQIPIELARSRTSQEYLNSFEDAATILGPSEYCEPAEFQPGDDDDDDTTATDVKSGANVVVVEHHHSRNDPATSMNKVPLGYQQQQQQQQQQQYDASAGKVIQAGRINESDSGSAASSLYAKINPRMKTRLAQQFKQLNTQQQQQQGMEVELRSTNPSALANCGGTLPRLLTFGRADPPVDVNVTSREVNQRTPGTDSGSSTSHEEAMKTIKRRNYPKVLPDIEKRRSLPPNSSLVLGGSTRQLATFGTIGRNHHLGHNGLDPPSPPPRGLFGNSKSLDCVEDRNEEEEDDGAGSNPMPITTKLHVGPLRRKTDSPKNQSSPSLPDACSSATTSATPTASLSSATSLPVCPIHGANSREKLHSAAARSEPRIVITPIMETTAERNALMNQHPQEDRSVDQPDCPTLVRRPKIPERGTKLPRYIIKPTNIPANGTLTRPSNKPIAVAATTGLLDNEAYQRLLARREKMPLPGEASPPTRIPSFRRINDAAAATKL